MKVLQIVRQYDPSIGGIQSFVKQLVVYLNVHGVKSDVLTLDRVFSDYEHPLPHKEDRGDYSIFRIPYFGSRRYPIAPRVMRFVKNYDVLHIHCVDFFADYLALTRLIHKKPMVLSTHGGYFHTEKWARLKKIYFKTITRVTLSSMERVIADSVQDSNRFRQILNNVVLIENAVDLKSFQSVPRAIDHGLMLFVGRISSNKRIDRLIRVLPEIIMEVPTARLVVVGPDWEGLCKSLIDLTKLMNVEGRVIFTGGVSKEELLEWMARAHCMVSASVYEGFGLTLVEAMSAGIVPVVQKNTSFQTLLHQGNAGILTDYGDVREASSALKNVMSWDSQRYLQVAEQAKSEAQRYSWDEAGREFINGYLFATGREEK